MSLFHTAESPAPSLEHALTVFPLPPKLRKDNSGVIDIAGMGRREDGTQYSIWLQVVGFRPYVYIELNPAVNWSTARCYNVLDEMRAVFRDSAPVECRYEIKMPLQGFRLQPDLQVMFVAFERLIDMYIVRKRLRNDPQLCASWGLTGNMFEDDIDTVLKMLTERRLAQSQWLTCRGRRCAASDCVSFGGAGHEEYLVDYQTINPVPDDVSENWPLNVRVLSFDIESISMDDNRLPCAYFSDEPHYLNCCIVKTLDDPKSQRCHVITLLPCPVIEEVFVHYCPTELGCLDKFAEIIQLEQPDLIVGYNIFGFDIKYLHVRREILQGRATWSELGRLRFEDHSELEPINWSSSGAGDMRGDMWRMTGRVLYDMYIMVLRTYKFTRYDLNTVADFFLKEQKHPIKPQEQFAIYRGYTNALATNINIEYWAEQYGRMVRYCIQDAKLVMRLFEKLNCWVSLRVQSQVCCVPVSDVLTKGETGKGIANLYGDYHHEGYVMTPVPKQDYDFEGGLVRDPQRGFFEAVPTLDFSSLYPTIMIQMNTCATTTLPHPIPEHLAHIPHNTVQVLLKNGSTTECSFVKFEVKEGIAARKVKQLVQRRGQVKKRLKPWTNKAGIIEPPPGMELIAILLDNLQNQLKIRANALFGFHGAPFNRYANIQVAMGITARGRELITFVGGQVETGVQIGLPEVAVREMLLNNQNIVLTTGQLEEFTKADGKKFMGLSIIVKGKVLYGDTDSVMIEIGMKNNKKYCHLVGEALAEAITKMLPPPLCVAYEKSMDVLLLEKKHYAAYLLDPEGKPKADKKKMLTKGVAPARRDYNDWVKNASLDVLDRILLGGDLVNNLTVVVAEIMRLINWQVPVKDLALVKRFTSRAGPKYFLTEYVMRKRADPVRPRTYQTGQRIEFYYLARDSKRAVDKMEDPEDIQPTDQLDLMYYLEHQFKKPVEKYLCGAFEEQITLHAELGMSYQPANRRKKRIPFTEPVRMLIAMVADGVPIIDIPSYIQPLAALRVEYERVKAERAQLAAYQATLAQSGAMIVGNPLPS